MNNSSDSRHTWVSAESKHTQLTLLYCCCVHVIHSFDELLSRYNDYYYETMQWVYSPLVASIIYCVCPSLLEATILRGQPTFPFMFGCCFVALLLFDRTQAERTSMIPWSLGRHP